ncbi:MAG: sugar ABC transporter ATP-binding protein, partial [Rhizobiales bacterium]|nr:sugar ABC transporter ATP-binding protein [Hyphomicrobiales bacterium]
RTIRPRGPADAVAAGICLLTEERKTEGILPNRSLRENLAVASLSARRGPLGVVAASIEVPIRTLSGGNQQKALLARWQLADMELFVLIEPTRGVDVGARAEIYRRLDALARAGKAIIVVSSDLAEVLAIADRILVVRDGRIAAEAEPDGLGEEALNLLVQGAEAA